MEETKLEALVEENEGKRIEKVLDSSEIILDLNSELLQVIVLKLAI